jgi:hypothetical protein
MIVLQQRRDLGSECLRNKPPPSQEARTHDITAIELVRTRNRPKPDETVAIICGPIVRIDEPEIGVVLHTGDHAVECIFSESVPPAQPG